MDARPAQRSHQLADAWSELARRAGIAATDRLTLAYSGGADSTALLRVLAHARVRPSFRCVHVDHGWRGAASRADAEQCARICRELGVEHEIVELALDPAAPSAEAVARAARYAALFASARRTAHTTLLTAHHQDDALEGALLRWLRGGAPTGWLDPARSDVYTTTRPGAAPVLGASNLTAVRLVRPLADLPRTQLRSWLEACGATHREDPTNQDRTRARAAVRHGLVPLVLGGGAERAALQALAEAQARLDDALERCAPQFAPPPWATLTRGPAALRLGGVLAAAELRALAEPFLAELLGRAQIRATGAAVRRAVLRSIAADIARGRHGVRDLSGGWALEQRADRIALLPPLRQLGPPPGRRQLADAAPDGSLTLDDGRRFERAELIAGCAPHELPHCVRAALPGDRVRAAADRPKRAVMRFAAELGVPVRERERLLVLADSAGAALRLLGAPRPGPMP